MMTIGFIGLGRMGLNMITRLQKGGHGTIVFDVSPDAVRQAVAAGAQGAASIADLCVKLPQPKIIWVMVPSGKITQGVIDELAASLGSGGIIIDGGNSNFHDSVRRSQQLSAQGIDFLDIGTSGGIWGLANGYCMMAGGSKSAFDKVDPILKTLAPPDGYLYVGPSGAGHYVKMIHNGIEYAMMQGYAEGFEILHKSEYKLDLAAISHLWNQGSVVRSWLLELAERAFEHDPELANLSDYVEDSGEGRWTVQEAIDRDVPAVSITYALMARFRSRQPESFSGKVLAALRNQFGGHAVKGKTNGPK
jgi:6-phosphogluconate dehydrogenase